MCVCVCAHTSSLSPHCFSLSLSTAVRLHCTVFVLRCLERHVQRRSHRLLIPQGARVLRRLHTTPKRACLSGDRASIAGHLCVALCVRMCERNTNHTISLCLCLCIRCAVERCHLAVCPAQRRREGCATAHTLDVCTGGTKGAGTQVHSHAQGSGTTAHALLQMNQSTHKAETRNSVRVCMCACERVSV